MMSRPVGIDLGTTYSAVAYVDEDGQPRVLANENGKQLVPSVVLFQEDGQVLVGDIAKDQAVACPERLAACVKRHMGDPDWRFTVGDRAYSPEEVSAEILKEMKRIAELKLDRVTEAVVTVPAYFLDAERAATRRAAELAGLTVRQIINEPTAAALSYGLHESGEASTIMVYDLGGGTFDVTIMRLSGSDSFEMVATQGNHRLGGRDWDMRIRDYVAERFRAEFGMDPRDDVSSDQDLYIVAEKAKIALSHLTETVINCQWAGKTLKVLLIRAQFEEMTADLLQLTATEVDLVLRGASMDAGQVDLVLLVGGSTKMPMVSRLLSGKARAMKSSRNPDHCVALGAAVLAARLVAVAAPQRAGSLYKPRVVKMLAGLHIQDRTPHGLGMLAIERDHLVNTVIIPKGTKIPTECQRDDYTTTRDNQDTLTVHLMQGEASDPDACVPLKTYDFVGIPPMPAGRPRIRVTFRHNQDTIVEVDALELGTNTPLRRQERPLVSLDDLKPRAQVIPKVVALLVDSSGSMASYGKMADAKRACIEFINQTDFETVETGLIQFGAGSRASIVQGLTRAPQSLHSAVDQLAPENGTPMAQAIALGIEMAAAGTRDASKFIVLFTDGVPDDAAATIREANRAKAAGIQIICVGVPGANLALLQQIASCAQDSFFAESGQQLADTFGNIARLISGGKYV